MKKKLFNVISAQMLDEEKRRLLGIGGMAGLLSACVETRPPIERPAKPETSDEETVTTSKNEEDTTVSVDCNCMPPGTTTPAPGTGTTTPPAGGTTTPPGGGVTSPPTGGTTTPQEAVLQPQRIPVRLRHCRQRKPLPPCVPAQRSVPTWA